jgi:hypothetical protein
MGMVEEQSIGRETVFLLNTDLIPSPYAQKFGWYASVIAGSEIKSSLSCPMTQRTMLTLSSNQRSRGSQTLTKDLKNRRYRRTPQSFSLDSGCLDVPRLSHVCWASPFPHRLQSRRAPAARTPPFIASRNHINAYAVASAWQIDKTSHLHPNRRPSEPIDHGTRKPEEKNKPTPLAHHPASRSQKPPSRALRKARRREPANPRSRRGREERSPGT